VVNIKCESCKCEITLQEETAMKMAVKVDGNNHVIPCPNPKCRNNITVSIEEK